MKLHDLRPSEGSTHTTKRVGRGHGSGKGKTSGKGMMGQKARSGPGPYRTFEGGQNRLVKRMPFKRGFTNIYRIEFETVNVSELAQFEAGSNVGHEELLAARLVRRKRRPVKILGDGELSVALQVSAHQFSASARAKIEAAGGSVTELSLAEYKVRRSRSRGFNGGGPKKTS